MTDKYFFWVLYAMLAVVVIQFYANAWAGNCWPHCVGDPVYYLLKDDPRYKNRYLESEMDRYNSMLYF